MEREPSYEAVLETFDDWSAEDDEQRVGMLVGLEGVLGEVERALADGAAFLLVGPPGTGKTVAVRTALSGTKHHMFATSLVGLMENTPYAGWWQTKLLAICHAARQLRAPGARVFLYVTDFANLFRESRGDRGRVVADDVLAAHRSGDLLLCGETTPELLSLVLRDGRWGRELRVIRVPTLDRDQLRMVLRARTFAVFRGDSSHKLPTAWRLGKTGPAAFERPLEEALALSSRFLQMGQPAAALSLLEETVRTGEFTAAQVQEMAAAKTGISRRLICDSVPLAEDVIIEELSQRVIGQPEAVEAAAHAVLTLKAGLTDDRRPLWVACLAGPSGVGKTELAKALAEVCFGTESRLIRFDMSEYLGPQAAGSLSAGIVSRLAANPLSVVLFDEIEKADFNSLDILLQVTSDGRCTAPDGQTCSLRQSFILLTTNVGYSYQPTRPRETGFTAGRGKASTEVRAEDVHEAMRARFRPEFLSRIDWTIVFRSLGHDALRQIAERELELAFSRVGLRRRGIEVRCDDSVVDQIASMGNDPRYGARPLIAAIRDRLLGPLAAMIAAAPTATEFGVVVRAAQNGQFAFERGARRAKRRSGRQNDPITALANKPDRHG